MKVGTAEPIVEPEKKRKLRSGLTGGANPGNGRGSGGGGDDGDDGGNKPQNSQLDEDRDRVNPDKSRILTWFLMLVVLMTFGGLIAAYIVIATNRAAEWQPFALPIQVWISTLIIFISSATYHAAKVTIDNDDQPRAKKWLLVTTVLGAAFISSQILAWFELTRRGLYMEGNPYAGFFYILTGVHALHVLGGIIALGTVVVRSWDRIPAGPFWAKTKVLAEVVGWYWHFMGLLWLVLFVLLGFWK